MVEILGKILLVRTNPLHYVAIFGIAAEAATYGIMQLLRVPLAVTD